MKRNTKVGIAGVLRQYFGTQEGQTATSFAKEVQQLEQTERLELAREAARNLGLTESQVQFPLTD